MRSYILCCILFIISSCAHVEKDKGLIPIVEVHGNKLTRGELESAIPDNISQPDSVAFAQSYISRWVKKQLLLNKAELNLTEQEKDLKKILEDYRASLLIHKYQQKILQQKYAPLITSKEIEEYYQNMKDNFILQHTILKGMFIKLPVSVPKLDKITRWYTSGTPEDAKKLEDFCFQNANKFQDFSDKWIESMQLSPLMPQSLPDSKTFYEQNKFYETRDSSFVYYVFINDYRLVNDLSPLEFVQNSIKAILLNKKRIEFIQNLEEELYVEGLKKKDIKYYY